MIIDTLTIVGVAATVVATLLSLLFNPFRRRISRPNTSDTPATAPDLSLVILDHGNAEMLERSLPLWMHQQYDGTLQIIVVIDEGDRQAEDVIKRLNTEHQIYSTFVPRSSRYMSRAKLAVTLGVKAAQHDRVMITNADCTPTSTMCLQLLNTADAPADATMVMGVTRYDSPCRGFYQFEHLHHVLYDLHAACRRLAYTTHSDCLIFSKQQFMEGQGFVGNLHLVRGEYENIVNRYARNNLTATVCSPDAQLIQQAPSRHAWRSRQTGERDTACHLRHGFYYRWLYTSDQLALHLAHIIILTAIVYGITTQHWLLVGTAAIIGLLHLTGRILIAKKTIRTLNIPISPWLVPLYEVRIIWHNIVTCIRHRMTDRNEFTSHKL